MTPRQIEEMGWRMGEVYAETTDAILVNLARHFKRFSAANKPPTGSWDYQMRMLAQMGQVNQETFEILSEMIGPLDAELEDMLVDAVYSAIEKFEPELEKAAEKGLLPFDKPVKPKMSANQTQAFKAYYQQSADHLNLVNTVMLESTQKAYLATVADIAVKMDATQGFLNIATGEVVAGVNTLNQAVSAGVQKMVENGITGFIDHGGHHWTPEAYVTMDIRTTLANTGRAAVSEQMKEYGCDLFCVSWHDGARPLCYPWQGKVISESGWRGTVKDLDGNDVRVYALEDTSYGEPAGLFGINCGHYKIPFIPGLSVARQPEQNKEQNDKEYQESQQQRALERKYREEKRDLNVLKAQGAPEEELRAQRQRVADARNNLDQFCTETGRARRSGRERTPTDATWQTKNGQVRRFNGNYVSTDQPLHVQTDQPVQPVQPVKPAPQPQAPQKPQITEELVTTVLPNSGIQPKDLTKWSSTPTDEQIISSLGGGDKTKGSCSSLAFAYAGNEAGYDVRDFRGGQSCSFFSMTNNIEKVANFDGVESLIVRNTNEIKACHELFDQMQEDKKYYLFTGRHAAVIRKTEGKLKYLELQSYRNNGWFDLNDTILRYRFSAHKSNTSYGMVLQPRSGIIDIESLMQSPDFIEMLKYINTAVNEQMKGATGGIK